MKQQQKTKTISRPFMLSYLDGSQKDHRY